ncbi:MAG: hypothetical protein SGPRY_013391, partial [Prymnesium sp.]
MSTHEPVPTPIRYILFREAVMAVLATCLFSPGLAGVRTPAAIVAIERASRELACSFLYSAIVRDCEPLQLFEDSLHDEWWFGTSNLTASLEEAARESAAHEMPLPPAARSEFRSPLLEARARRATPSIQRPLSTLEEPENAEPVGPPTYSPDRRAAANRRLCRQQLQRVSAQRTKLEGAILDLLDPM